MKANPRIKFRALGRYRLLLATIAICAFAAGASAAVTDYYWTAAGSGDGGTATGGTGTWDTTTSLWRNDTANGTLTTYPTAVSTTTARFGGTAGTVTLAGSTNLLANQLVLTVGGYTIAGASGSTITLNGSTPTINNSTGATMIDAVLAGSAGMVKAGAGTLILGGANTWTGLKSFSAGITRVSSVGTTASTSSNLGGSGDLVFGGGTLEYTGAGESSNRAIQLFAGSSLNNFGYGALTLSGTFAASQSAAVTLNIGGSGSVNFTGNIGNGSGGNTTALQVVGSGGATLSGANTFTGGLSVARNSLLTLDYATNATVVNAGNAVTLSTTSGGNLYIKGNSSGTTAQTLGAVSFGASSSIVVDANGGSGTTLTVGNLNRTSPGLLVMDISSANSTLVANTNGGTGTLVNGVIVGGNTATSLAGFLVKTSAGYDWASAASAGTGQTITALGDLAKTTLTSGFTTGNTVNYKITSNGTTSITTGGSIGTLRVDTTSADGGTLSIASGQTLTNAKNGILFDGTGSYTISGAGSYSGISFDQFSTGTVTLSSAFVGTRLDKFGPGLLINNTPTAAISADLNLFGGVYRAGTTQAMPTSASRTTMSNGAILELTSGSGNLTRALGNAANQINILGDAGFSASGSNRSVNFGGAGANVTWGSTTSFVANGNRLLLSSATSDSTIDFQNAINFNGLQREVSVGNGTASTDAVLSGVLSSSVVNGGLNKTGTGTLSVTNVNTYGGTTTVTSGTLLVDTAVSSTNSGAGTGSIVVSGTNSTLGGVGQITPGGTNTITIGSGSILAPGDNALGTLVINSASSSATGLLTLSSGANLSFDLNGTGNTGDTLQLLNGATGDISFANNVITFSLVGILVSGQTYILFDGTNNDQFTGLTVDGGNKITSGLSFAGLGGGFENSYLSLTGGDIVLNAVPEPATWVLLAFSLTTVMVLRRRRSS